MVNNKDSMFFIDWEDSDLNEYRIGILAQLDGRYYLRLNISKEAQEKGCIGFGGFLNNTGYESPELFEAVKNRIFDKKSENPLEELKKEPFGASMIDSFKFEEIRNPKKREYIKKVMLNLFDNEKNIRKDLVKKSKNDARNHNFAD